MPSSFDTSTVLKDRKDTMGWQDTYTMTTAPGLKVTQRRYRAGAGRKWTTGLGLNDEVRLPCPCHFPAPGREAIIVDSTQLQHLYQ